MLHTRIYNTFINDFLQGNVPEAFPCSAYLVNSQYAELPDTKYYLKHINDFSKLSAGSLYTDVAGLIKGSCVSSGAYIENTYYRDETINDDTSDATPLVICNDNFSAYSGLLLTNGVLDKKYKNYIDTYGFFYFVTKNNTFAELSKICKDKEHYVVVLGDDIDNVIVNGNAFGTSRQHPFRGIFDGNGYTISISQINATTESNGLFGYIAEDGVVKNVTINKTAFSDSILVNSTVELNIDMLKGGVGDIRYGVLAGTNYGTLQNIILSGSILYDGCLRPAIYFTNNKSSYDTLYSPQWQSLITKYPDTALQHLSELNDMTNICYPTQLCLNSDANIVPYVGYFAEGVFNKSWYREEAQVLRTELATIRAIWPGNESSITHNTDHATNYSNYMYDIYTLYTEKHKPTEQDDYHWYDDSYVKRTVPGDNHTLGMLPQISFRLGPNDKAAYLIGNLVGFNGGTIASAAVVTTATFNSTTVALIGGLAGRDAGGKISDTYVCTQFEGTSGLYTGKVTVETNEKEYDNVSAHFNTGEIFSADSYSIDVKNANGEIVSASLDRADLLAALPSFSTVYTADTDDVIGRLFKNDSLNAEIRKFADAYNIHYSGSNIPENLTAKININGTDSHITLQDISIAPAMLAVTSNANNMNIGELMTDARTYSGISAVSTTSVDFVEPAFTPIYPDIMPSAVLSYTYTYTSTQGENKTANLMLTVPVPTTAMLTFSANVVTGKVGLPISTSSYNVHASGRYSITRNHFDMILFPILNIGGMFGEYVYSDGQSIINSRSELYAVDFTVEGLAHASHDSSASFVSNLSDISLFASNITFDSSLKTNPDFYQDNEFVSANAKLQNKLDCTVQTVDSNELAQYYLRDCDAICLSAQNVGYAHYLNCYSQIAPALVTTNITRVSHEKAHTHYPDIGIQYTDQLFYEVGLNMGVPEAAAKLDMDDYNYWSRSYTSAARNVPLSGVYFNYPAQVSSCDASTKEKLDNWIAAHPEEHKLWHYSTIFNAAFDTSNAQTAKSTMYVSKQVEHFPTHYPLYRSRATLTSGTNYIDASVSLKLADYIPVEITVPVKRSTYQGATPELGEPSQLVLDAIDAIAVEHAKTQFDTPIVNYTYTYSSKTVEVGDIKPANMFMQYSDSVLTAGQTAFYTATFTAADEAEYNEQIQQVVTDALQALTQYKTDMQQKGYIMSSDSFENVVKESAPNVPVECKDLSEHTTIVNIENTFEEHESSDKVINFNMIPSDNCTLEIADAYLAADLTTTAGATVHVPHYYAANANENTIALVKDLSTTAHDINDLYNSVRHVYGVVPATATFSNTTTVTPTITTAAFNIAIDATVNLHAKRSYKVNNSTTLTGNYLTYAFVPTSADIADMLNANAAQQFTCTGLSANDLRYALIVDSAYKPIMDIELTTTAVDNDGYIIEFPSNINKLTSAVVHLLPSTYDVTFDTSTDNDTGVAINIENGNN